jgi:hypothetical protein
MKPASFFAVWLIGLVSCLAAPAQKPVAKLDRCDRVIW